MDNMDKNLERLNNLMELQEQGTLFPCPRCGHERMNPKAERNALSRRVNVYICSQCGMEEALLDAVGKPPLPIEKWSMSISFNEPDEE